MIVWVTRDEGPHGPLSKALCEAGLESAFEPVIERHVVGTATDEIQRLGADDWLVFSSAFAVKAVDRKLAQAPRVAVVGPGTRDAARRRGFRVEWVGDHGGSAALFKMLRETAQSGVICYPRSALAEVPQPWAGVKIISPVVYETRKRSFDRGIVARIDVVAVASPSAVDAIGPIDRPFASIGPTTSAALRRHGIEPWLESPDPGFSALAASIAAQSPPSRNQRA